MLCERTHEPCVPTYRGFAAPSRKYTKKSADSKKESADFKKKSVRYEIRTHTGFRPLPPQSSVSTNSTNRTNETWIRAKNGTRTRDPDLGKVVLYQLSYFRSGHFRFCDAKLGTIFGLTKFSGKFFSKKISARKQVFDSQRKAGNGESALSESDLMADEVFKPAQGLSEHRTRAGDVPAHETLARAAVHGAGVEP